MLSYRDGVSIGEIGFYTPALIIGVVLSVVHGFGYNSGWIFLVIFAIVRIAGSCLQLVTIHYSTIDLYTWAAILQSIGLSPLLLATLGLLSRVVTSINKTHLTFPHRRHLYLIHLIVTAGLVLGIYGGTKASGKIRSTGRYVPSIESKISVGLFILACVLILLAVQLTALKVSHAEMGERRLLLAAALSLPFLAIRVAYSGLATFYSSSKYFNLISGNVTVWLGMGLVTEAIVVIIYEITGLTVRRLKKADTMAGPSGDPQVRPYASPPQMEAQQPYG